MNDILKKIKEEAEKKQQLGIHKKVSFDLTKREERLTKMNDGDYNVTVHEAFVDPQNDKRVMVCFKLSERTFFDSYFHPYNMNWHKAWDMFFTEHSINNTDELIGRKLQISIKNNQSGGSSFSNITAIAQINAE